MPLPSSRRASADSSTAASAASATSDASATSAARAYRDVLRAAAEDAALRKGERTALRIRWAACELLEQVSLNALKVQDICAHLGIAQGTLYQYFADRDSLLQTLLLDFVAFLRERMEASTQGSSGPEESAQRATRAYCELFAGNTGLMKCLLNHYEAFPEAKSILSEFNRGWTETIVRSVKKHRAARGMPASGVPRTSDAELRRRVYALGGMVDQYLSWIYLGGDAHVATVAGDLDAMVNTLNFIWQQALRSEFAAR
ncbi:MAG: betI [Rhodoferax sp.]|nr:betI [Rhodoferax sp.]